MDSTETPTRKRKNVSRQEYGTKCVCCDPRCDVAMKKIAEHYPERYAYFLIPKKPKDIESLKTKLRPKQLTIREKKIKMRNRIIAALPRAAELRANDTRYSSTSQSHFASLHLPNCVFNLCPKSNGTTRLVDAVPVNVAQSLNKEGRCLYTESDRYKDGTYVPLPNVPLKDMFAYADFLVKRNQNVVVPSLNSGRATRNSINPDVVCTMESIQIEQLKAKIEQMKAQIHDQDGQLRAIKAASSNRKKQLDIKEKNMMESYKSLKKKSAFIKTSDNLYGLTRASILSRDWHNENPRAANHLFGFRSWKDLVYTFHALFDVLPPDPKVGITPETKLSLFEQYLVGFLRIHTGMTIRIIAMIYGRNNGHVGRLINKAVKKIGSAGKDLSILDITPAYLKATCPQKYKDEGLDMCCAVPDGKDFMIYTTRKNTLFARASYSDKVHHSACRCISWSTPMGLSFEHTDLFLGRASEKKLVELWGPRLKKCPRGWFMLSDRGFFDTARFYPNMNHQKTPKFLSGRDQFTAGEVSVDRRICKLRYTCEVAFARVTKTRGLRDVISNDFFSLIDAMNHWGHATINLDKPLMQLK